MLIRNTCAIFKRTVHPYALSNMSLVPIRSFHYIKRETEHNRNSLVCGWRTRVKYPWPVYTRGCSVMIAHVWVKALLSRSSLSVARMPLESGERGRVTPIAFHGSLRTISDTWCKAIKNKMEPRWRVFSSIWISRFIFPFHLQCVCDWKAAVLSSLRMRLNRFGDSCLWNRFLVTLLFD